MLSEYDTGLDAGAIDPLYRLCRKRGLSPVTVKQSALSGFSNAPDLEGRGNHQIAR
jgi:hypothetical protein